ncbi:MAG: C25 family cysteine peptidase [Saprospiraceae bacterium]
MKNYSIIALICLLYMNTSSSQMLFNGKFQYGNEWINTKQAYYKFFIQEDGFYRISYDELIKAGIPIQTTEANKLQIFKNGEEVYIKTSTESFLSNGDFIEFYASKNRAELDAALFASNVPIFNEEYSMFTDTSAYYLTWNGNSKGLRIEEKNNDNSNPLTPESSYIRNEITCLSENPTKRAHGLRRSLKMPDFDEGQGYGTVYFNERTFNLDFKNVYTFGNDAVVKIKVFGDGSGDNAVHRVNFFLDNNLVDNLLFNGYKVKAGQINIHADELKDRITLKVTANGQPEDMVSVSTVEYSYESEFKFDNSSYSSLHILPSLTRKTLVIEDFNGGPEMLLYDVTNHFYIRSTRNVEGKYDINLPPSDVERQIIILNENQFKKITSIIEVKMEDYSPDEFDYLMVSSKRLRKGGNDAIEEYKNYRTSTEGGGYKVKIAYIEDIEEEFGFGVRGHNIALRNFFQYTRNIWPKMHYVLIIGKGLEYQVYRKGARIDELNFVPTYSEPASDYLLVCDTLKKPFYTIGRLPVIEDKEVSDYLNKVKEHETYLSSTEHNIDNREWLKKIVHLAGGDATLYATLGSQLAGMEAEIESNNFGGQVETFYKQSSSSIEVITSEKLKSLINNGVSIISFMGHSISYRLDFSLDNISEYQNKGRYHVFIAMGCYAGEMFLDNRSISETQNLTPDKGSIIYLSNTSAGLPGILYKFGTDFYSQIGNKYYNLSMGDAMREVFGNLIATNGQENIYQALSTSFNGDPVIRLNNNRDVDLTPDGTTAKSKENFIFADQKSFDFEFDLVNLGIARKDSVKLLIENVYPDGTKETVSNKSILIPTIRDNIIITVPINENKSIGYNKLLVTVDPDNKIIEGPSPVAENNNVLITGMNEIGYNYYVIGNNARPLYPAEFAIINESKPILVAYNGNIFAKKAKYFMELDTTEYFNSPILKSNIIQQTGGTINWGLVDALIPNQVYYWRVRPDSSGFSGLAWKNSSFIYMPGNEIGWNQSHFFQHTKNDLNRIQITEPKRNFEYKNAVIEFRALNGYIELPTYIRPKIYWGDSVLADYQYWNLRSDLSGILVAVLNPINGRLITNQSGSDFESVGGPSMAGNFYFLFATETKEDRLKLINFLKNNIADQSVVIVQTLVQYNYSLNTDKWESDGPENLVSLFKSYGAKSIDQLIATGSVPYNLIYGKNRSNYETKDKVGNLIIETDINHAIPINQINGIVSSKLIGPAISYDRFLWDYNMYDPLSDKQSIEIYGVNSTGIETKLFGPLIDLSVDLKTVDANLYPNLKLVWKSSDTMLRTAPNLDYWRVYYKGLPDITYNPAISFKKNFDTLNQGEIFKVDLTALNVSTYDMDSLLVKFTLVDQKNVVINMESRYLPVKAFENLKISYKTKTSKQFGLYKLIIELNPHQDQKEFITYNNTAVINYYVQKDKRRPIIRVSFDGVVIRNGDIVSPQSQIVVFLHDENNSIPMVDPSLFNLKIQAPDKTIITIDPGTQSNVSFIPASGTSSKNEARMIINGDFQLDGEYTFFVKAKDANGNYTSETEDLITYKIIKESSVSNVFNYPNPFTTKTRFVYTLTGSLPPSFYKIQIMTVSGKVVRELSQNELGPLSIGTHMTEFDYDGTDEYGQKLANGVYLYRAIFKDEKGNEIKKLDTNTDKFFVNNFGKMVILR